MPFHQPQQCVPQHAWVERPAYADRVRDVVGGQPWSEPVDESALAGIPDSELGTWEPALLAAEGLRLVRVID